MKAAWVVLVLIFAYLAYHMYTVQILRHDELYAKAKSKYTAVKTSQGHRGEIYDYKGNLLVGNIPCGNIFVDPTETGSEEKCRMMADFLAKELSLDAKEVYKDLTTRTITIRGKDGNLKTIPKRGFSAGTNPTKDAVYFLWEYSPLMNFCAVPVLPAT